MFEMFGLGPFRNKYTVNINNNNAYQFLSTLNCNFSALFGPIPTWTFVSNSAKSPLYGRLDDIVFARFPVFAFLP